MTKWYIYSINTGKVTGTFHASEYYGKSLKAFREKYPEAIDFDIRASLALGYHLPQVTTEIHSDIGGFCLTWECPECFAANEYIGESIVDKCEACGLGPVEVVES